mmetsp:Transcript_17718/g.49163  ORF Transcript_17718/g.49163 Transcript_17718/m.49163 type:complete len:283 (+) Transcript_17718:523-1371(+)
MARTSSGAFVRFDFMLRTNSSGMSVLMVPGRSFTTRMLNLLTSSRRESLHASMAALLALYAELPPVDTLPQTELRLRMRAPSAINMDVLIMCGSRAFVKRRLPKKLTFMVHSNDEMSRNQMKSPGLATPALFTMVWRTMSGSATMSATFFSMLAMSQSDVTSHFMARRRSRTNLLSAVTFSSFKVRARMMYLGLLLSCSTSSRPKPRSQPETTTKRFRLSFGSVLLPRDPGFASRKQVTIAANETNAVVRAAFASMEMGGIWKGDVVCRCVALLWSGLPLFD